MQAPVGPAARGTALGLAWLAGVAWQLPQATLPPRETSLAMAVAAVALLAVCWRWRRRRAIVPLLVLGAALLAFASTSLRAQARLADALDPALEGVDLVVTGVVDELPQADPGGTRFVLERDSAMRDGAPVVVPPRLALGWYRGVDEDAAIGGPEPELRAGQRWRLPLRLRAPHGTLNPHGFDVELWLFEQGIGASGSVRSRPELPALKLAEDTGRPVERLRQAVREAIVLKLTDPAAAGVLAALAIGDQAAIDREGWDLFRITGVAHLMSISGLHVTMFAWLAGALLGRLWRLSPRLLLACPAPLAALWGGWFAATGYALLAGWGVPAQRTVWMIGAVVLLRGAGLRWPLHAVLLAAALVVVAIDPWALMQPGFWLSFFAVALLVASEPVRQGSAVAAEPTGWPARAWAEVKAGLRTQAIATVGLAPLSMVFFQQISLVGFVANAVAIPLVTLLITPLALLGVLLPPLWLVDGWVVAGLMHFLQALAGLPLVAWTAAAAPPWAIVCGLLAGALAVLPLPWRLRLLSLPLLLPLLAPPVVRPMPGQFELIAADVGQGTAVLVRTQDHLLVFDTGPQLGPDSNAGSRVLLPLLRARGENRVDLLMLSHRDSDHVGGAASLISGVPVLQLSSSLTPDHPLLRRGVPHRRCDAGQSWDWDGVHFEVLHPRAEDHAVQIKSNALSCVLRVQGAAHSALLTGDIEAAQEAALVQREGDRLKSELLLVPHHGSRTSSTAAFIRAVQPRLALVQAGYRNRFGHPAPDVVARYEQQGVGVVRSDRCGAWTLPQAPDSVACERQTARRYWHHQDPAAMPLPPAAPAP